MPRRKMKQRKKQKKIKTREQVHSEKRLKKIFQVSIIAVSFSSAATLFISAYFKDIGMFYAGVVTLISYIFLSVTYYLVFMKKIFPLKTGKFFILTMGLLVPTVTVYISGGYMGPLAPTFFLIIILFSRMVGEKRIIHLSIIIASIYMTFFLLEEVGILTSFPMSNSVTIKYSIVIIDILMFIFIGLLAADLSKESRDAVRFYQLRSVRLAKIKERLEVLVRHRTKELEISNYRLRKAQGELKKNYEELQKLDKKKDEFISIASHELQTPMASMHGFSQLLQDKKIFKDREKRDKYLKIIEDETERLSKMVKNMLNLSRIDLGTLRFDIEEVDVNQMFGELQLQLEQSAKEKGIKLTISTNEKLPKMITDMEKLRQILINIINNSVKYTEKGGINVSAAQENDSIKFTVADTGIGIPKSKQERIFERFYQVESPYTRKVLGAGLGLSIVKEFIKTMGGRIWLESKVGKGTTFYFTLPIKSAPAKSKAKSPAPPKAKKRYKTK